MLEILYQNLFAIITIIFGLTVFVNNKGIDKRLNLLFIVSMVGLLCLVVADMTDYYLSSFEVLNPWRYVTSCFGYACRPLVTMTIIFTLTRKNFKPILFYIVIIPAIINLILSIISPFTNTIFSFSEDNYFHRGIFWYYPIVLQIFYILFIAVYSIIEYRSLDFNEFILIILIAIFLSVSIYLESFEGVRFLGNSVATISISFYYLCIHTQIYKRDQLTGLLNRMTYYSDTKTIKNNCFFVSLDMNELKKINDIHGHQAGDLALQSISKALLTNTTRKERVYRIGGDEFVIISYSKQEDLKAMLKKVQYDINAMGFSLAYGYVECKPEDSIDTVYQEADSKMYECKKLMKEQELQNV